MPSQLKAIVEGIAAQLAETRLFTNVITYKPKQPGPLPMVFFQSLHLDYPETTYGEMTLGHTLTAYVVLAAVGNDDEAISLRLFDLVPTIIEAIGHDLDAHGALNRAEGPSDGQVTLLDADDGELVIAGHPWSVVRLRFRVIETFTYIWSL
jgi:hypothetical protein